MLAAAAEEKKKQCQSNAILKTIPVYFADFPRKIKQFNTHHR